MDEPTRSLRMRPARTVLVVGLVGLAIAAALAVRLLARFDGDPTIFASFGEDSVEITTYAENLLGRDVITRDGLGHDGRFFFVQANDPWLTDPETKADLLDRPTYRSQRMLYPIIASGGGALGPQAIVWALVVVNVLAMGAGTWCVAVLASDMGGSPWWGLAFVLNVGLISEMNIDAAGVVAAASAFGAIAMLRRDRLLPGIVLLTAAALCREAMLIAAAGSAFWLWRRAEKKKSLFVLALPSLVALMWGFYVRWRLGFAADVAEVEEIGWPFVGLIRAFDGWLSEPVDFSVGVAIVLLLVLFARRVLISDELVGWSFLGFVLLAMLFTRQVWLSYFDVTRAIAPTITAFILLVFVASHRDRERGAWTD